MPAFIDSKFCTQFLLAGAAVLTLGCSADAAGPDAGAGSIDARDSQPRADAEPFDIPDANPNEPDAEPGCIDSHEPNETSAAATSVSDIPVTDKDSSGGTFTGTAMDTDVDWYTYLGDDTLGGVVDPTVEVAGGNVEVCMYLDCVSNGSQTTTCPEGEATADTDGALVGCCSTSGFTVDLGCPGADDDANIYIRVKAASAGECVSYSISYHY